MKYAFAAVALAALARAQTLADIPECALPCLDQSITDNTSCATTDIVCVCENFDAIQGDATTCVVDACGAEVALNEVLPAAQALCENPTNPETTAPAETSAPAAPETSAPAAPEETVPASSSDAYEAPVSTPSMPSGTAAIDPLPTVSEVTPPEVTPVPTAGAASLGSVGAVAMVVLGAMAL